MNFTEKLIEDAYKLAALKLSGRVSEAAMTKEIPLKGEVDAVIKPDGTGETHKSEHQSIANSEQPKSTNHVVERVSI